MTDVAAAIFLMPLAVHIGAWLKKNQRELRHRSNAWLDRNVNLPRYRSVEYQGGRRWGRSTIKLVELQRLYDVESEEASGPR